MSEFDGWTDEERLNAYRKCALDVANKNNLPGFAFLGNLITGNFGGAIGAWIGMVTSEATSTKACEACLTEAQKKTVQEQRARDAEDARERRRDNRNRNIGT